MFVPVFAWDKPTHNRTFHYGLTALMKNTPSLALGFKGFFLVVFALPAPLKGGAEFGELLNMRKRY